MNRLNFMLKNGPHIFYKYKFQDARERNFTYSLYFRSTFREKLLIYFSLKTIKVGFSCKVNDARINGDDQSCMGSDGITNDRGKIGESHPQDPRSLSQLILRCIVRRNRINRREGLDVRARGACYPSSDKGTRFYASLSSIRAVYSSRPESRQLVACLCP